MRRRLPERVEPRDLADWQGRALRVELRRYLKGVEDTATEFYELTLAAVGPAFAKCDEAATGALEYPAFKALMARLEPARANWQVYALFQEVCARSPAHRCDLPSFVALAIDSPLLARLP